ncbi:MAG TPA: ABC transporter ATP-binding protein/permease [Magnetospirillaceae bacterium]|jgi:putative ATP-binding cassette transporter
MAATTKKFLRDLWGLTKPYWQSEERWKSGVLLAAVVALSLIAVGINVIFTEWNNLFYNTLQDKNEPEFWHQLGRFSYIAAGTIVVGVYQLYLQQMLQIRWRRWLTNYHVERWMGRHAYYRLQIAGKQTDNPDQRIAEDIARFVDTTLTLSLGLLSAVVTLVSFTSMLWTLSGPLTVMGITIPGYMVWVALVYAIAGTWIMHLIGRPLIRINFQQQQFEANYRYALVRLRENAEGVALYGGEAQEARGFELRFADVVRNWWNIMRRMRLLNFFSSGYSQIAIIFPFVVSAPRFFSGAIQLGGMMQIASAFGQVQGALSWFINVYGGSYGSNSFTEWKAVVDRLTTFERSLDTIEHGGQGEVTRSAGESKTGVVADSLDLRLPDGSVLLRDLHLSLPPGSRTLVTGPSGSGKSTLFRTLGGIWPYAKGVLTFPKGERLLFLPQKPYIPIATLRAAVSYPDAPESYDDISIRQALTDCGLAHLIDRLDEEHHWAQQLSGGEQQRLAFARALLLKPRWLFMDEATSALDEPAEAELYRLLIDRLPGTALISIAHRPTLEAFHDRRVAFGDRGTGTQGALISATS